MSEFPPAEKVIDSIKNQDVVIRGLKKAKPVRWRIDYKSLREDIKRRFKKTLDYLGSQ